MKKIKNLYRISLKQKGILFFYYLFKALKLKPTLRQLEVNELFHHLIYSDGKLISEDENTFKVYIFNFAVLINIRKYPSSDLKVFGQVFRGHEYKSVVELYKKHFGAAPKNIIDAGANVGYTSVFFNYNFPETTLAIIEPSDENFAMIEENFAINDITAQLFKGGLWDKNTYLKIVRDFRDQSDWSIRVEETNNNSGLRAFTVDHVLQNSGFDVVDIFKIDIEGAEKQVFSAKDSLGFLKHTKCIALEIHDEFDCRKDIEDTLEHYGFELIHAGELTLGINKNLINFDSSELI
ncbi:FkbM family methyltransferase [Flavobacterium gelidilacus]|uniref:FkbM family methyltransferase n=1 Tax=Flavobacterium gelidilacus TaxID=206041 RepID=UPI0004273A3E|nr:FkbM family methyltransferase [Flavobacterium gelidilacus]